MFNTSTTSSVQVPYQQPSIWKERKQLLYQANDLRIREFGKLAAISLKQDESELVKSLQEESKLYKKAQAKENKPKTKKIIESSLIEDKEAKRLIQEFSRIFSPKQWEKLKTDLDAIQKNKKLSEREKIKKTAEKREQAFKAHTEEVLKIYKKKGIEGLHGLNIPPKVIYKLKDRELALLDESDIENLSIASLHCYVHKLSKNIALPDHIKKLVK